MVQVGSQGAQLAPWFTRSGSAASSASWLPIQKLQFHFHLWRKATLKVEVEITTTVLVSGKVWRTIWLLDGPNWESVLGQIIARMSERTPWDVGPNGPD